MQNVHFTPPELAKIFNVNVSTIKRWVDKGYLRAVVTSGGHRRINRKQLADFLKKYPKYATGSYVINRILHSQKKKTSVGWKEYYHLLHTKKSNEAEQVIEQAYVANISIPDILDSIITPALVHIGNEWAKNRISIYEEHRMSFIVRMHLFRLSELIAEKKGASKKRALLACVSKEQHEISLQMLALIFQLHGWQTHTLGINISTKELLKAASALKPKIICLSKMYSDAGSLEYLQSVTRFSKKNKIDTLYGGSGWTKQLKKKKWNRNDRTSYLATLRDLDVYLQKK